MSTLIAAPFSHAQQSSTKLPMDIRGRTAKEAEPQSRRKKRDAGDLVAKKRMENIRRHSAHTRHRNGIINAAERNRLVNTEKQMDRLQRRAAANISRYQHQLRQELYEMEASRRALRRHSVTEVSTETHTDMKGLAKFAARGRYLYSVRNETKTQKEEMESYNSRLEQATKLLKPARKHSVVAMDNGRNMGSNPADVYHEVGRRMSMARLESLSEDVFEDETLPDGMETVNAPLKEPPADQSACSPAPFDMVKLRSELGPELQKELDNLDIGDDRGICLVPIQPSPNYDTCPEEITTEEVKEHPTVKQPVRLKLPPLQVNRHFVLRRSTKQQLLASLAKPNLSTVSEN